MPRYENPDFGDEEPKKKDFSGIVVVVILILFFSTVFNIKEYPTGSLMYDVTNIHTVAGGHTSVNVHYVIDNWDIPEYEIRIVYGDYKNPILQENTYETRIYGKFPFGSSQPDYVLYLPKNYKF
jgi:hypothetical protein